MRQPILLLVILVLKFRESISAELRVLPFGDTHVKALGDSTVFTCDITDLPPASPAADTEDDDEDADDGISYDMKWFDKNNQEIRSGSGNRVYVEEDRPATKKLYITSITPNDAGRYTCSAVIDGKTQQKTVNLQQYKDITFDHAPRTQHPEIYKNALIECRVSGAQSVSWRYKGKRLSPVGKYSMNASGLTIANITKADDGDYTCRAEVESAGRYSETNITVIVHIPPKITKQLDQLMERIEDEILEMKCEASGTTPLTYEFIKENNVNPVTGTDRIKVDSDKGLLKFSPVKYEDSGRYTCRVNNDVGKDFTSGTVKVLVRPQIQSLDSITEKEGQRVSLVCKSRGVPAPEMSFQKLTPGSTLTDFKIGDNADGRIVVRSPEAGRLELVISSLIPDDAGNYTCRSRNSISSDDKRASIVVKFRPKLVDDHKTIAYIWPGKTTNVTCNVKAEPLPNVKWTKDNRELTNNYTFTIFSMGLNNSLQVRMIEAQHTWIYGKYHCGVHNEYGDVHSSIEMRKAEVPSYSLNLTESIVEPNRVILNVSGNTANEVFPIIGYRVEYNGRMLEFERNGDEIILENLNPSTTYMIDVSARNDIGCGKATRKQIRTANIRKPYPIEIISEPIGKAGYEFDVEWKTPSTGGSPIQTYEFRYRKTNIASEQGGKSVPKAGDWIVKSYQDDPKKPIRSFNLTGLDPETSYEIQIKVKNEIGWSDESSKFSFQTVKATTAEIQKMQAAAGLAVAIALIVILAALVIIIDIACYFTRKRGVTAFICIRLCGGERDTGKEKNLEQGDGSKEALKEPPQETDHEYQIKEKPDQTQVAQYNNVVTSADENKEDDTKLLLTNETMGVEKEVTEKDQQKPEPVNNEDSKQELLLDRGQELSYDQSNNQ